MSANLRYLLVLFCVLLTVGADTYPAFNVKPRETTADGCLEMAETLFGHDDYRITIYNGRYIALACDGRKRVECDTISGGIFATDNCESPNPADGSPKDIPTEDEAMQMGMELLTDLGLLPVEEGAVVLEPGSISNTFMAHEYEFGDGNYVREDYQIDVTVNIKVSIEVVDQKFMITGGGGKFQVTYGSCGKLIAVQALWREICGEEMHEIISLEEAQAQFNSTLGPFSGSATVNTFLGYESAPFGVCQKLMPPVWVHEAEVVVDGKKYPVRPQASRAMVRTGSGSNRRDLGTESLSQEAHWPRSESLDDEDYCEFEAAIEYLGEPYGLALASENAAGFKSGVMHTAPIGNITYEKSNAQVLESDFTTNDDIWADSVDMVFYTGHANMDGWMVTEPDTGAPSVANYTAFSERPEGPGDLLGHQDLEWLVIAACGPHQDERFEEGAGNVFDRWRGIFHGLHIMFAYGSASSDSAEEGSKFMRYAQEGNSLIDAWFRAAREVQPPGVIVTAMWVDDARDDHLPGYGPVSKESSSSSQERWFMWTTT